MAMQLSVFIKCTTTLENPTNARAMSNMQHVLSRAWGASFASFVCIAISSSQGSAAAALQNRLIPHQRQ